MPPTLHLHHDRNPSADTENEKINPVNPPEQKGWRRLFKGSQKARSRSSSNGSSLEQDKTENPPEKWTMGILNDKKTEEVPGESSKWHLSKPRLTVAQQGLSSCSLSETNLLVLSIELVMFPNPRLLRHIHHHPFVLSDQPQWSRRKQQTGKSCWSHSLTTLSMIH